MNVDAAVRDVPPCGKSYNTTFERSATTYCGDNDPSNVGSRFDIGEDTLGVASNFAIEAFRYSADACTPLLPCVRRTSIEGAMLSPTLAGDARRKVQLQRLLNEVRNWSRLRIGWDTYGGSPPPVETIFFTTRLLSALSERPELPLPNATPMAGGAFLRWSVGDSHMDLEVESDSVLIAENKDGVETMEEDERFEIGPYLDRVERFCLNG